MVHNQCEVIDLFSIDELLSHIINIRHYSLDLCPSREHMLQLNAYNEMYEVLFLLLPYVSK